MSTHAGVIALVGRPNVGKSTLLNQLVDYHLAAVSHKVQTTRHLIRGILTHENTQFVFVDTPGIHQAHQKQLNRALNRAAVAALEECDAILFMVEAGRFTDEDQSILDLLKRQKRPIVVAINKVDKVKNKEDLLVFIDTLKMRHEFEEILLISALKRSHLDSVLDALARLLPESEALYPEDQITDRPLRFVISEIIREQVYDLLHQELPYDIAIEIESFSEGRRKTHVEALILVAQNSQKAIVIGKQGSMIREIGIRAREEIERLLDRPVDLRLWVRVEPHWVDRFEALDPLQR
jgi:GTP-binding protein Era